jgi:putative NIF3 family GTP cyclohydrolase 1 type 2
MEIGEFIQEMERLASPDLADEMDEGRIGLIVEGKQQIKNICCALDATPEVVRRSVESGADMLVVHHTPIWNPITAIRDPLASLLREAMASGLNIYVMHTNFDRAASGVNDTVADMLGLTGCTAMSLGIVGDCGLSLEEISRRLSCPLRAWGDIVPPFRLAVVGGSGFYPDLIEEARALSCKAFLSAELKHSVMRQSPLVLIEATHYALEAPAMRVLAERYGWQYIDDRPFLKIWT